MDLRSHAHAHLRDGAQRHSRARIRRLLPYLLLPLLVAPLAACAGGEPITAPAGVPDAAGAGEASNSAVLAGTGTRACTGPATASAAAGLTPIVTGASPTLPVTYTDSRGKAITITSADRILALDVAGTLATTVYALGLGDRLIGRDVSTGIPDLQDLPLVTRNGHELNGEAILDLDPDLVLTDYGIGPLEVQLQLEDSGIPVVILSDQRSRASIAPQIREVAAVFGIRELGDQLANKVEVDIAAVEARIAELAPTDPAQRLRMAFLYLRGTAGVYSWLGKGSGADDLIEALQGIDVASEIGIAESRPINAEGLVRADPDMFLMMTNGLDSVGGAAGMQQVAGVSDTDAGRNSCIVDMIDYQVLSFGPQFPATLNALATAVYEQAAPQ